MKHSLIIQARKVPGLLAHITGDLSYRGVFPDLLWAEIVDDDAVRLRLDLTCSEEVLQTFIAYVKSHLPVESVQVSPATPGVEQAAPVPVMAMD